MNLEQARRILQISAQDDIVTVKKQYRRLIGRYHPDAVGSDQPEHVRQAQEINAAYHAVMKSRRISSPGKGEKTWQGVVNEKAFCDRDIYQYYSLEVEESGERQPFYRAARGRYMWDPEEEEFELFLISIRQAMKALLDGVEEKAADPWRRAAVSEEEKFRFQTQLFCGLAFQYIDPIATLRKIAEPCRVDGQGRKIYRFRAFLVGKGMGTIGLALSELHVGDSVRPVAFWGNKIAVADSRERMLGCLSLEDDPLYFCMIPLLKEKLARVKLTVREVEIKRNIRPYRVKADIDFYFRLEDGAERYTNNGQNLRIADILRRYEKLFSVSNAYGIPSEKRVKEKSERNGY